MISEDRRLFLLSLAGAATSLTLPGAAQAAAMATVSQAAGFDPEALTWDEAGAGALWRRSPVPFVVIDDRAMQYEGVTRPAPSTRLTASQIEEARGALQAASAFYRRRGMGPPELPMANGAFHVFFVTNMGDTNGASGEGRGTIPLAEFDADILGAAMSVLGVVPLGSHMMLNAENYFSPSREHPWGPRTTLAHELLHTIDRYMIGEAWHAYRRDGSRRPDGIGNWWSEGNIEAVAPFALADLGYRPLNVWRAGHRSHAQNIGMRPYDYPLTLRGAPDRLPAWVLEGLSGVLPADVPAAAESFFRYNATYFTASFWRFLLQEEAPIRPPGQPGAMPMPGDFELMAALRRNPITAAYRRTALDNPHMDPGVPALDRFIRDHHPTWGATGLYRAFPAFIAHWIEWPDQIPKSRSGLLAHPKWINAMFMDGAPKREISADTDIMIELTVLPLAAKAIRFEVPQIGPTPQDYPPVTITVSIIDDGGQARAIDNIHVGLRGQCLGNGFSQPSRMNRGRVRRWASVKATPLKRRTVNDETILSFINVAPDPTTTRPVRIRVQVSLQVASTTGQVSYHPPPVETAEGTVALPPSRSPPAPDVTPLVPIQIETEETRVVLFKDADLVRMLNNALDINSASAIERESDDGPANRQSAAANVMGAMTGASFRPGAGVGGDLASSLMAAATTRPFQIALTIPTMQPGYVGSVSGANVIAEWIEPTYARFAEYGVSPSVQIETDAVQVQITSSGDGAILGTFSADFDRGSQNVEAAFRGRIEGRFSLGIANDEAAGDQQMPEDPSSSVSTDFFISAGRAGMSTSEMGEIFRQMAEEMQASGASASPTNGAAGGATGQANVLEPGNCRVTPAEFDAWFQETFGSQPMFTPAQRTEMRNQFLSTWDFTEQMICASRNTP